MAYRPRFSNVKAYKLPRSYVCYDLETSGLGEDARVVEIGAVRVIDGYEDESLSTFVALPEGMRMDPAATAVNHITDAMLAGAPSEEEAYDALADLVGDLPLVGQNIVAFDNRFVDAMARRLGARPVTANGCQDTMLLYRDLVGKPANLAAICEHYGVENRQAHRALGDAVATSDCYLAIVRDAASRSVDVRDLDAEPVGHELDGELVCFTGNSYDFPKRDCEVLALEHGASLHNSVTKRVTLLVTLEGRESAKVRKARQYGIATIGAEEFLARVGLTAEDLRRPNLTP